MKEVSNTTQSQNPNYESRLYEIVYKFGLHARPAAQFVKIANGFQDLEVNIGIYDKSKVNYVNGKSILGLLGLAATQGKILEMICIGKEGERNLFYKKIESLEEKLFERYKP